MAYFPAFIEIEKKSVLVVGGGKKALKKIQILLEFGASITVIAPEFIEEIQKIDNPQVKLYERGFHVGDVEGMDLVVAATESKKVNHVIAENCKERNIFVNVVDQIEDCTFIFPSYIKQGDVVAAFSSSGKSPVVTQYLKEKNHQIVNAELGELTEFLGSIRGMVKEKISTEQKRKAFYKEILMIGLGEERIPGEAEVEKLIEKWESVE